MIYQTVYSDDFVKAFDDADRSDNFSVNARRVLFDYLSDISDMTGEDITLDVIAICCDWAEYAPEHLISAFGYLVERLPGMTESDYLEDIFEELEGRGTLLRVEQPVADDTFLFVE